MILSLKARFIAPLTLALALAGCGGDRGQRPDVMREGSLTIMREDADFRGDWKREVLVVQDAATGRVWILVDREKVAVVQAGGFRR